MSAKSGTEDSRRNLSSLLPQSFYNSTIYTAASKTNKAKRGRNNPDDRGGILSITIGHLGVRKTSQPASVPNNSLYTFPKSEAVSLTHKRSSKHSSFVEDKVNACTQTHTRHHLDNAVMSNFGVFCMIQSSTHRSRPVRPSGLLRCIFSLVRKPEEETGHRTRVSHHPGTDAAILSQNWKQNSSTLHTQPRHQEHTEDPTDACRRIRS